MRGTRYCWAWTSRGEWTSWPKALAKLPPALAGDPRFERYRAAIAQERQDWSTAADAYLRAWRADPSDHPGPLPSQPRAPGRRPSR